MRILRYIIFAILGLAAILMLRWFLMPSAAPVVSSDMLILPSDSSADTTTGYRHANTTDRVSFPDDLGPHPDFQTEWWYYTGNLTDPEGRHFGYQLTFFRRALQPPAKREPRLSDWATNQVYMAHFALTDVTGKEHHHFERLARGATGLAGAQAVPFTVWLDDWSVEQTGSDEYRLTARQDDLTIALKLVDTKGSILHGDQGYSQKGPDPGNASFYSSQTRLASEGTITLGRTVFTVSGLSWKDHEYSTSALSEGQIGWDWFSIQLDNQYELMLFQIRRDDGSIDPFSSGTLIAPDASTTHITRSDFSITTSGTWKSPVSQAIYPAKWVIQIPSQKLSLDISPYLADQEMVLSYNYWEGAVKVTGMLENQPVTGNGYVELTGYSQAMTGEF